MCIKMYYNCIVFRSIYLSLIVDAFTRYVMLTILYDISFPLFLFISFFFCEFLFSVFLLYSSSYYISFRLDSFPFLLSHSVCLYLCCDSHLFLFSNRSFLLGVAYFRFIFIHLRWMFFCSFCSVIQFHLISFLFISFPFPIRHHPMMLASLKFTHTFHFCVYDDSRSPRMLMLLLL